MIVKFWGIKSDYKGGLVGMIDPPATFQRERRRTDQRKTQKTPTGAETQLFNLLQSVLVRTAIKTGRGNDEVRRLLPLV